jgi:hypothetical protein
MSKSVYRTITQVDWKQTPLVIGRVVREQAIEVKGEPRRTLLIDSEGGLLRVFVSFALNELFDQAKPGMGIYLCHLGNKPLKAGRTLHVFDGRLVELKPEEPLPAEWANQDTVLDSRPRYVRAASEPTE